MSTTKHKRKVYVADTLTRRWSHWSQYKNFEKEYRAAKYSFFAGARDAAAGTVIRLSFLKPRYGTAVKTGGIGVAYGKDEGWQRYLPIAAAVLGKNTLPRLLDNAKSGWDAGWEAAVDMIANGVEPLGLLSDAKKATEEY